MSTPAVQHTASAFPALLTIGSALAQLPVIVSTLVGLAALFYYYLVITKELRSRQAEREQIRQSGGRLVEKLRDNELDDGDAP